MSDLKREEFLLHMEGLREDTSEIKTSLKELNSRTGKAEQKIAVLEDWRAQVRKASAGDEDDARGAITARDVKVAGWVASGIAGGAVAAWKVLPAIVKLFQP